MLASGERGVDEGAMRGGRRLPAAYRRALLDSVAGESNAYGFTLVIWTTGALALVEHPRPRAVDAFAFLGGALLAVTLIVLIAFARSATPDPAVAPARARGALHLVSVCAGVLAGWGPAALLRAPVALFAASFASVAVFHAFLGAERLLAARVVDGEAGGES